MRESTLKDKTIQGVGWSAIDNMAQYLVSFIVSIVLARLLSPEDYGLLGIIAIFTAVCTALINGGFGSALIRKKNATDDDYCTVFLVNMGMSFLLYVIIFFSAPCIAFFFRRDELVWLTRTSSLGMIIGALGLVQQTRLTKCIDFKTQTKITFLASVASGIIGIVMAILGFGVWALVAQNLGSQIIRTILLWFFNKWIPRLYFSMKSFKELFDFGWKLMMSGLLATVWQELFQVIVGRFYSPITLGQYTKSKKISELFSSNLTLVVQRVTYPVLSEIQGNNTRMLAIFRRIIKITMCITAICMIFLGAISEPLVYCLIGPKWYDASIYLPLICLNASLYPLHSINLNMLQVQGRSDLFLGLEIVKKIIALGPLFIGAFVGIMPMLCANLAIGVITYFLNSFFTGKLLGYDTLMQIKDVAPHYGIALLVALPVWYIKYLPVSNWLILIIQIVIGLCILSICYKIFKLDEYKEIKSILRKIFKNKTKKYAE